jgi:hypothetical protein
VLAVGGQTARFAQRLFWEIVLQGQLAHQPLQVGDAGFGGGQRQGGADALAHGAVAGRRARKGFGTVLLDPSTSAAHHRGIQFVLAAELGEAALPGLQLPHDLELERRGTR